MADKIFIVALLLCFLWTFPLCASDTKCEVYPKEVSFGDTLYIVATHENNSEREIPFPVPCFTSAYPEHPIYVTLEIQGQTFQYAFESDGFEASVPVENYAIPPHTEKAVLQMAIRLPFLEDLRTPFWDNVRQRSSSPVELKLVVKFRGFSFEGLRFEETIVLKRRRESEMIMIDRWYDATPQKLFPQPDDSGKYPRKVPSDASFRTESEHQQNKRQRRTVQPLVFYFKG